MSTEADLCAWFQGVAERHGYTVYNEWADFDMLLVAEDGTQVGVEAKLRSNVEVLAQAISGWQYDRSGPHRRAALVPKASSGFDEVADALGVHVYNRSRFPTEEWQRGWLRSFWDVPASPRFTWGTGAGLPDFVPDVVGGKPCPVRVTPWKIKAIRLCLVLRRQGYLTARDFKDHGVDMSRWRHRWLRADGREGRSTRWVPIDGVVLPDEQHPGVARQMAEVSR